MKICAVSSCKESVGEHGARGWCIKHYMRWHKFGDPEHQVQTVQKIDRTKKCSIDGCDNNIHNNRGWCRAHYMKWFRNGDPLFVPKRRGYGHPMYKAWISMKQRCDNPKLPSYARYGGRGITYDPRWTVFENFLNDMGERPKGMTLDRRDNDGNYTKDNCRWATPKQQQNNTRTNIIIELDGVAKTITEWAEISDIYPDVIAWRLKKDWDTRKAIFEPMKERKNARQQFLTTR